MNKRIIAAGLAILLVAVSFASCGKKFSGLNFIDGDGNKAVAVTDESGNIVLDEDGSVVVFATDSKGNFATAENGDPATAPAKPGEPQKIGDYFDATYVKLPLGNGWKIDESGSKKLIKKNSTAYIEIGAITKKHSKIEDFVKVHTEIYNLANVSYTVTDSTALGGIPAKAISTSLPDKEMIVTAYLFKAYGGFGIVTCGAKTQADFDSADFESILKESVVRV